MSAYCLPAIDYLRLRCHLKALQRCELPSWKGSLLRGAFGHALKKTVCTMKIGQPCDSCLLRSQCAYTRIFETFITKQPPPMLRGLDTSPRPYIFEPHDRNQKYQPNDLLWFDLILIGNVIDFVPYVIYAILQLAHSGLGVQRQRFELATVYCFQPSDQPPDHPPESSDTAHPDWHLLYDGASQCIQFTPTPVTLQPHGTATSAPNSLTLKFLTQTRLKFGNDLAIDFNFRMLAFKMLRRVLELAYFYADREPINWEFRPLLQAADGVTITQRHLHWVDYDRYSNRQQTKMKLGGFVGELLLEGELSPFLDLLHYSEVLHVGKGTTFGLGRIVMEHG